MTIVYAQEQDLPPDEYITVIGSTYMGERRPIGNPARIAEMLAGSSLIVTARGRTGAIVGVARGISDAAWVCYLADVCVREGWQKCGIGRGLLDFSAQILDPRIAIVLMAYPEAVEYYRHIGMGEATSFLRDRSDSA